MSETCRRRQVDGAESMDRCVSRVSSGMLPFMVSCGEMIPQWDQADRTPAVGLSAPGFGLISRRSPEELDNFIAGQPLANKKGIRESLDVGPPLLHQRLGPALRGCHPTIQVVLVGTR